MDPFNPISSTSITPPDTDSPAADDAKADERRVDKARAFQQALGKGPTPPTTGTPQPPRQQTGKPLMPGAQSRVAADQTALSPALMRLQAAGHTIPDASAQAEAAAELTHEAMSPSTPPSTPAPTPTGAGGAAIARGDAARDQQTVSADPTKQAAAQSNLAAVHGKRDAGSGGGAGTGSKSKSNDPSTPDPRMLTGPVLLPMAQNYQAAVAQATTRPAPPPELLQQLVEFAAVHRNADGLMEFRLGLVQDALGGLQIQLAAYGNRRVGLKIKSGGKGGIGEEEVAGLIDALRKRNVEVVDVELA